MALASLACVCALSLHAQEAPLPGNAELQLGSTSSADATTSASTPGAEAPTTPPAAAADFTIRGTAAIEGRVSNRLQERYLVNARVTIEGTLFETLTDEFGGYRFTNLPAGEVKVQAFFTGLEPQTLAATLAPGQRATLDFELLPGEISRKEADTTSDVVLLEKFRVISARETSANMLATNEQRFSTNIKSVIETDAFGDVTSGNVGEFLKFMPGVAVDYDGADPDSVSVRGFGPAFTAVTGDGAPIANAASGEVTRKFQFDQLSINNISRVEVSKVPLPSHRADSLGGSINLVSKNPFESTSRRTSLSFRALVNFNSNDTEFFQKTPGPRYEDTYKAKPGFDFTLNMPVTQNLKIMFTGQLANQFNEAYRTESEWDFNQRTLNYRNLQEDPYLRVYRVRLAPKAQTRESAQLRADWRVARNHVFTFTYGINYLHAENGTREMVWDISDSSLSGNDANPSDPYDYRKNRQWGYDPALGGYYVESPEGQGSVRHNTSSGDKYGLTHLGGLRYRYAGNNWEFDAALNATTSKGWQRDTANGAFSNTQTQIIDSFGRLGIYGIHTDQSPEAIKAYAKRTQSDIDGGFMYGDDINVFKADSYNVRTTRTSPYDSKDGFTNFQFNARRTLTGLPFYASIKVGGDYRKQERDIEKLQRNYTYIPTSTNDRYGVSAITNQLLAMKNAANFLDDRYSTVSPGWGLPNIPWVSPKKVYDEFVRTAYADGPRDYHRIENDPSTWTRWWGDYFMQTANQLRDEARYEYLNSYKISESVTALYFQLDGRFFSNRLQLTTGVRYEMTDDRGAGAYAPNSGLSEKQVRDTWVRRGRISHRTYDDIYPSFHANYNITENLLGRFAYAMTMARPDFSNIIPQVKIDESDSGVAYLSEIESTNPDLEPYKAHNFDLSFEYYMTKGAVLSAGLFYKNMEGYVGTIRKTVTTEELDRLSLPHFYEGYTIKVPFNLGTTTTVKGFEISYRSPKILRYFTVQANYAKMYIDADPLADLGGYIPQMGNFIVTMSLPRLTFMAKVNYKGRQKRGAQTDSTYQAQPRYPSEMIAFEGYYEYSAPRMSVDLDMSFKFSRRFTFFATARDILGEDFVVERYNALTPSYARNYRVENFGTQLSLGVRGNF